jgi:hypothetical protein
MASWLHDGAGVGVLVAERRGVPGLGGRRPRERRSARVRDGGGADVPGRRAAVVGPRGVGPRHRGVRHVRPRLHPLARLVRHPPHHLARVDVARHRHPVLPRRHLHGRHALHPFQRAPHLALAPVAVDQHLHLHRLEVLPPPEVAAGPRQRAELGDHVDDAHRSAAAALLLVQRTSWLQPAVV